MKRPAVRNPAVPDPPSWLAEIDPRPGPPFLAMGVRGLGQQRWLTPGDTDQLTLKGRILRSQRDQVTAALPGTEAAVDELADAVATDVANATANDGATGGANDLVAEMPAASSADCPSGGPAATIEHAAGMVAEDLCLLVPRDGGWVLGAACVCFPSHWRLGDKVGRPVAAIHSPVPHYDELAGRIDRFLDRLAPGQAAWRRNWLVHSDDRLFAPVPPPVPALTVEDAGSRLWLRSERQTLRRLPATGSIAFTIRTQQAPLAVVASRPDLRAAMADAVASWPDDLVDYRGGQALRTPLLAWLRRPTSTGRR